MRLLNDQVQICHSEVWGYVCENFDWTDNDASVVCRELGFFHQGTITIKSVRVQHSFIFLVMFQL